jgi:hypothetical protein
MTSEGNDFIPTPDDIRRRHEAARMANHAAIHGVSRLISEMNEEQLLNLQIMVRSLADPAQGPGLASHLDGVVNMHLHFRYQWCACGEKHMDANDLLHSEDRVNNADHWSDDPGEPYSEPGKIDAVQFARASRDALMDEYNLIPFESPAPDNFITVKCKLCGMQYPNLRDRMLRTPDDCSGCRQKSRHG